LPDRGQIHSIDGRLSSLARTSVSISANEKDTFG
jgi:hypothetical protein